MCLTSIKDRISIRSLLEKLGMLSVNQLNAQIKLVEIWKAINVDDYPLKIEQQTRNDERSSTRADTIGRPVEIGKTNLTQKSCVSDAIRLWNIAPMTVTSSMSLARAKIEIQKYVRLLPI